MLGALIRKEIRETILDLRFTIVSLLCLVLIPLGMYVSIKGYERRLADYQLKHQIYREQYAENAEYNVEAEGFRPPSVLSVFALGLEESMPDKVTTSRPGVFKTTKESGGDNSPSLLFGQADLLFNVSFVISLAALIFTFNGISGEKETGTLRGVLANSVPRTQILLSKIVGSYATLLIPFVLSVAVALLITESSPNVSLFSAHILPSFLVILAVSFVFILTMVTLGVLLSTLTHKTITSMTTCLLAWVVFTLAIPKISPMIARVACPTESQEVISMRKRMTLEEIDKEYVRKGTEVYAKYNTLTDEAIDGYFGSKPFFKEQPALKAMYGVVEPLDKELFALDQECQNRIGHEIRQLDQAYAIAKNRQNTVAMGLSRLSPISCYAYVVSALANTGVREFEKLAENARRYQEAVSDTVYEKYQTVFYKKGAMIGTRTVGLGEAKEIPEMRYEYMSLAEALASSWDDLLFLVAFNFIFFVLAFVSFNMYDVR